MKKKKWIYFLYDTEGKKKKYDKKERIIIN